MIVVSLIALLLGSHRVFLRLTAIRPPSEAGVGISRPPLVVRGLRSYIGSSWLTRERGVWEYHLEGGPFSLGYANARLGSPLLIEAEEYLFSEMRRYIPSALAMQLVKVGVLLRYRTLPLHIPLDQRIELAGLAEGQPDLNGDFLPTYHRIVFYHALHDITQGLEHSPMLGCTALAAARGATTNGHLVLGRNFDFEGPELFDREKAVLFFKPQGRLGFVSVAWSGMMGVVTGLNQAGIYVSVNALRSDDKSEAGVPVELLLREVLESAHSLDEALAIIRDRPVLVPDLYLIGDGQSGEAAVVERSPSRFVVRRMPKEGPAADVLTVANHGLSPEFAGDRESARLRDELTSGARQARADELVLKNRGRIDPAAMLAVLRDKRGPGDTELGLGNRNTLDALIATHSVVVDATERVLWVGVGPHALGRYVAYDLKRELGTGAAADAQPQDLPEDPVLHSDDYRAFLQMKRALRAADTLRGRGQLGPAIETAQWAVALQPRSVDARLVLADLLAERARPEDVEETRRQYTSFLALSPPHRADARRARSYLERHPAGSGHQAD